MGIVGDCKAALVLSALALTLGGCSTFVGRVVDPPAKAKGYFQACLDANGFADADHPYNFDTVARRFKDGLLHEAGSADFDPGNRYYWDVAAALGKPGYIHRYLDCYVGVVAPGDIEGRLLRGQILTTLMAQYAAESLVQKENARKASDAQRMIQHIRRAQRYLVSSSAAGLAELYAVKALDANPKALDELNLTDMPNFRNAKRTAAVFDLAVDITRVDAREAVDIGKTIFSAIISGNPAGLTSLFGYAAHGFNLSLASEWYGAGFIYDAELSLRRQHPLTGKPRDLKAGWRTWTLRLRKACETLQHLSGADSDKEDCMPSRQDMRRFLVEEYGLAGHPAINGLPEK